MPFSFCLRNKTNLGLALCAGLLLSQTGHAAIVSASYEGTINNDSGLGLFGQTLRFDLTYDDSVSPSSSWVGGALNDAAQFDNYLINMVVSIGTSSWTWNSSSGYSSIFLYNDSLISYSIGSEDRISSFVSDFSGSDLIADAHSYSASLFLSDNSALTGLTAGQYLPNPAPDADLFTRAEGNTLQLEFYSPLGGDPWGNYYLIETAGVSNVSPVPLPAAFWVFGSGLIGLVGVARRRKNT